MTGAVTASTIIGGISAAAGLASAASNIFGGKPKTPAAITAPPAPTVNDAQQQADQQNITNQRQGALANLLQPTGAQSSTPNMSLRTVLGG